MRHTASVNGADSSGEGIGAGTKAGGRDGSSIGDRGHQSTKLARSFLMHSMHSAREYIPQAWERWSRERPSLSSALFINAWSSFLRLTSLREEPRSSQSKQINKK